MIRGRFMENIRKNLSIEFWRFIFIILIACLHWSNYYFGNVPRFEAAYAGTEFFFIVSGYLLCKKYCEGQQKITAWQYTLMRIKKIYYYYICAFALLFIYNMLESRAGISFFINELLKSIWEIFMLHMTGLKAFGLVNYPTWYISAMLIAGYFIYAFINTFGKKYFEIIAPLSVLIIYVIFSRECDTIDVWGGSHILNISDGITRAFGGMNLGIIGYFFSNKIKEKYYGSKNHKVIFTIIEIISFLLAVATIVTRGHGQSDFYIIAFLFIGISLAFSDVTLTKDIFNSRIFAYAGKISYVMFLNQILVMRIVGRIEGMGYKMAILTYVAALTAFSALLSFIMDGLKRSVSRAGIIKSEKNLK